MRRHEREKQRKTEKSWRKNKRKRKRVNMRRRRCQGRRIKNHYIKWEVKTQEGTVSGNNVILLVNEGIQT